MAGKKLKKAYRKLLRLAQKRERAACAKVVEEYEKTYPAGSPNIAVAVRRRKRGAREKKKLAEEGAATEQVAQTGEDMLQYFDILDRHEKQRDDDEAYQSYA